MRRRGLAIRIAGGALIVLGIFKPALADYKICNNGQSKTDVSFGYKDRRYGWTSRGWWTLAVGSCATVFSGRAASRVYYFFAIDADGRWWGGNDDQQGGFFCITPLKYTLRNRDYEVRKVINCEKSGLKTKRFRETRLGAGIDNYTYTLTARDEKPRETPVASTPPNPAPAAPGPPASTGTACQRFPNLC
jgi:uncharacterized membrane protein